MNFRVYAGGVLLILVYQLAIAAAVIWFVVHCEKAGGAAAPPGTGDPVALAGGESP